MKKKMIAPFEKILPKCEVCKVEIDTKTNRARWSDNYWAWLCKECMTRFNANCIEYERKQRLKKTGCEF